MVVSNTTPSFEDLFFGPGGVSSAGGPGVAGGGGGGGGNPFAGGNMGGSITYGYPARGPKEVEEPKGPSLVKQLQGVSKIRAIKAVREATGLGLKESKEAVDATFESIREQLSPDPVGTLRREFVGGKYAFVIKPGEYLLIDPSRPAYKSATSDEAAAAKGWQLLVKGSG